MGANDARRRREIGAVIRAGGGGGGGGGDFGDGNRRCIRREDGMSRADLGQLAEDGCFERRNLGNGFNDEIGSGEVTHLCRSGEARPGCIGIGSRNALFRHIFLKQLICTYRFQYKVKNLCLSEQLDLLYVPANFRLFSIDA